MKTDCGLVGMLLVVSAARRRLPHRLAMMGHESVDWKDLRELVPAAGGSAGTTSARAARHELNADGGSNNGTAGRQPDGRQKRSRRRRRPDAAAPVARPRRVAAARPRRRRVAAARRAAAPGAGPADGDCLCHGTPPAGPTSADGPYKVESFEIASAGCVFYPTDAEPPFAAVTVSDGFLGTGGCGFSQTGEWLLDALWGHRHDDGTHTGSGD